MAEAMQILKRTTGSHVKLEIVPIRHIKAQSQGVLVGQTEVEIHERVRSLKENGTLNSHQRGRSSSPVLMRPRLQAGRMAGPRDEIHRHGLGRQDERGEKWSSTSSKGSSLTDKGSVQTDRRSVSTDRGSMNTDRGSMNTDRASSVSTEKSGTSKSSMKTDRSSSGHERVQRYEGNVNREVQVNNSLKGNHGQIDMVNDGRTHTNLPLEARYGDRTVMENRAGLNRQAAGGRSHSLGRGETRGVREPLEPETIVSKTGPQNSRENRNNANNALTKEGHHSSSTSLQSLA